MNGFLRSLESGKKSAYVGDTLLVLAAYPKTGRESTPLKQEHIIFKISL